MRPFAAVMRTPALKLALAPPLFATAFVGGLAACAIDTTFLRLFAGLVAAIVLLMAVLLSLSAGGRQCWAACAVVLLTIAVFDWPLHLSYLAARPGLERLARKLRAGEDIATPTRVGLIVIRGTELRRRIVNHSALPDDPAATDVRDIACLWTNLDPSGFGGFMQCRPQYVQANIFSQLRLDDRWQFINED